jgi:hypothetical protein
LTEQRAYQPNSIRADKRGDRSGKIIRQGRDGAGAAQGIGATYARALAAEGAAIAVNDIADPAATVAAIKAAGGRALVRSPM